MSGISGNGLKCFITTAVCRYSGKSDDCEELTLLRKFRDDYMLTHPDRKPLVDKYYVEAPSIVTKLDSLADKRKQLIYSSFLHDFIHPAIDAIKNKQYELALMYYSKLFKLAGEVADTETLGE